jgi:hypothetical protein
MALNCKATSFEKKEQLNMRIDPAVAELLRGHCEFIDSSQNFAQAQ